MERILFFSKKEFAVIVAVGLVTGLLDSKVEIIEFTFVARTHPLLILNDYLAYVTGGPLFGDLLDTWLEYGGVLAACLVRKPGAGTVALTINGFCQVFVNGNHDPHLFYGAAGLGADIVFAAFSYKRYDAPVVALAGVAAGVFWYPIVWFTHGIYLYPYEFILSDLALRIIGSAVADGLLAGGIALVLLGVAERSWVETPSLAFLKGGSDRTPDVLGVLFAAFGVALIAVTAASTAVASFFVSIGPDIAPGQQTLEEYNPGYVLGLLVIFLAVVMLAFWHLRSRYSG